MNLSPKDFSFITNQILSVARVCCPGKVIAVLEGGYGNWVKPRENEDFPSISRTILAENCASLVRAMVEDDSSFFEEEED